MASARRQVEYWQGQETISGIEDILIFRRHVFSKYLDSQTTLMSSPSWQLHVCHEIDFCPLRPSHPFIQVSTEEVAECKWPLSVMQGKTAGKDLATEKTTYPSLLGVEESKRIAEQLISEAVSQLKDYPADKAAPLICLAQYIKSRTNWRRYCEPKSESLTSNPEKICNCWALKFERAGLSESWALALVAAK